MDTTGETTELATGRLPKFRGPAFLYPFVFAQRSEWILYGIGTVTAIVSGVGFPFLDLVYGIWTTSIVEGNSISEIRSTTNKVAGVSVGIGLLQLIVSSIFWWCFSVASSRITDRLRREYLRSVIYQDAEFFERVGPGEVGTRMVKDIGTIRAAVGEKLSILIWSLSILVTAIIMAFTRASKLAGVVFSIIPFTFILFALIGQLSSKAEAKLLVVDGQAGTLLEQILGSVRVVQSFAAETFLARKYDAYLQRLQRLGKWRSIMRGMELGAANCVIALIYSLTFWYGSRLVVGEDLQVGLMLTIFYNMFNALFAVVGILPHLLAIKDSAAVSARLLEDIERTPKIDVCRLDGLELWSENSEKEKKVNAEIELRGVTFVYPSRPDHKSLDGVNLVLEGGKVTALVGASGSGKSTIASLLLRYYDPVPETGGQVLLSGHDLRTLKLSWLRSQISLVSQDPQLFTASIFDNVAYGLTGTPHQLPSDPSSPEYAAKLHDVKSRVERALKQAQAWEFVCNLPEGMDTRVSGARTGVLSGGQRQRIAAARALIRRPRILLLDEGTSALDSETEQKLMAAIHQEQAETGMTTILIAHRLSSIQNADTIIALSNGQVMEQGTYSELMSLEGVFAGLVRHQLSATQPPSDEPRASDPHPVTSTSMHSPLKDIKSRPESDTSTVAQPVPEALERGDLEQVKTDGIPTRFGKLLRRYGFWILGGFVGGICIGASFPIAAWLVGLVIKTFAIQDDDSRLLREARLWALWFLVLAIVNVGTSFVAGFFLSAGADRIDRRLRLVALSSLLKQEIGYFDQEENASGALTAAVASNANNVTTAIGLVWQQLISASANFLGTVVLGFVLSWKLSLVGFAPVPFIIAAAYYNIVFMERHERLAQKPLEEASAFASENVDSIKTVAALGREDAVMDQFDRSASKHITKRRYLIIGSLGFGVGFGSILILSAIVMWWGTALYTRGRISIEDLYSCFEAIVIAGFSASRMFTFIPDLARMIQGFRRVCEWEDRRPEVAAFNPPKLGLPETKSSHRTFEGEIVFNSCTLKYASRPKPAITDMSFTIKAGQNVAFCGPSGGGKSSIISMISRFYDPSMGTILLDGQDIRSIPLDEYRSQLALVSQDAVLYEGTFRENITLGEDISQDQLERACRDASILEFIQSLPEGFETGVGFKGSQMSGGQRQRICIARALLRNPKILLLDEATSALDAESEKSVKESLEKASMGRTTISIAHRLSTIQGADLIHVVEDGRIVESGSHTELLALNGRYVDLIRSQL